MNKKIFFPGIAFYITMAIFFGFLTTLFVYQGFGVVNQVEQLPKIYRLIDSSYLENDFLVNNSMGSIARLYYSKFIMVWSK